MGVVVGGVGLSEFKYIVKHTFPQGFVRVVTKKIRAGRMQIKLRLPQDKRELIVGGKIEISKGKRDAPARGSKISGFHPRNFIGDLNNIASI